jgi:toxin FitB
MILLDTNIFIYLAKGTLPANLFSESDIAHASISKIEALGFPSLPVQEFLLLSSLFEESHTLDLTSAVIDRAINLRQVRRMSLGDSIIAATALENDVELWTANIADFTHVEGLRVVNPLEASGL